jgi:hypothetical protein
MVGELRNFFSLAVLTERNEIMEHFFFIWRDTRRTQSLIKKLLHIRKHKLRHNRQTY